MALIDTNKGICLVDYKTAVAGGFVLTAQFDDACLEFDTRTGKVTGQWCDAKVGCEDPESDPDAGWEWCDMKIIEIRGYMAEKNIRAFAI